MSDIRNTADLIDVRDIIERFEELESDVLYLDDSEREELRILGGLLSELGGSGGDEQWRGDWYPVTLVRDSYFETYAQGLAEDIGAISSEHSWPLYCIDWEKASRELQMDYSSVEYDGVTYWYR